MGAQEKDLADAIFEIATRSKRGEKLGILDIARVMNNHAGEHFKTVKLSRTERRGIPSPSEVTDDREGID